MNVLVVDDIAVNRKLLRAQLEAEGFEVAEAVDGLDALEVLRRQPVDAVLSDILMPRMDGYRLCHEVRKNPALRALRFVLYSSTYTSPADVNLSNTVGADLFVAKPAPIAVILNALQSGRGFPTIRLWGAVEEKLIVEISNIWAELLANPGQDLDACLHKHLDPLAQRLNIVLGN